MVRRILALTLSLVAVSLYGMDHVRSDVGNAPVTTEGWKVIDFQGWPTTRRAEGKKDSRYILEQKPMSDALFETDDVIVICDIVSVGMTALTGLDEAERYGERAASTCHYRVGVRVRKEIKGSLGTRSFAFAASKASDYARFTCPGDWVYYRGITLKIGLRKAGGRYVIVHRVPVQAYPPFRRDGLQMFRTVNEFSSWGGMPGMPYETISNAVGTAAQSLILRYGDHTVVAFTSGNAKIKGDFGEFYDFGETAMVRVWCVAGRGNLDYWRRSWLADPIVWNMCENFVLYEVKDGKCEEVDFWGGRPADDTTVGTGVP